MSVHTCIVKHLSVLRSGVEATSAALMFDRYYIPPNEIQMALPVTVTEERKVRNSLCSKEIDRIESRCSRIHERY